MIQNFTIGDLTVSSYNAMFYLGCVFFIVLLCAHRKVYDFPFWKTLVMAAISIPLGYGCTSLLFGFEFGISEMNFSGFSWYGAVFFMPIAILIIIPIIKRIVLLIKRIPKLGSKIRPWEITAHDYIHNLAAPFALMNGFMKLGCFLYGCCYGHVCSWGFYNNYAGTEVFPIQLVECIWNFAVCGFILWYERKSENRSKVYPMYMIVYSIGRIFLEFGRAIGEVNFQPLFGVIKGGMIYAAIAICIGLLWLHIDKKVYEKNYGKKVVKKAGKDGWRH